MAANYWESTQRRYWQFTREQLEGLRKKLEDDDQTLVQMYPLPQLRHLSIYFNQRKRPFRLKVFLNGTTNYFWYRDYEAWETPRSKATGHGYGTIVHSTILFESRDQTNKPVLGDCDCGIPGL